MRCGVRSSQDPYKQGDVFLSDSFDLTSVCFGVEARKVCETVVLARFASETRYPEERDPRQGSVAMVHVLRVAGFVSTC